MTTITRTESLLTAEERCELYRTWRERYALRTTSAADCLLYALLRGKDARRGFTPISNTVKLANGQSAWEGYRAAVAGLDNAYMDGRRLNAKLRQLFPSVDDARMTEITRALGGMTTQLRKGA